MCMCVRARKTEAQCDATGGTILQCKFPENISSTQTGFTVYFDSDDDSAGMCLNIAKYD